MTKGVFFDVYSAKEKWNMNKKIEKLLDEKIAELDSNPIIKQKNKYGKYLNDALRLLA